VGEKIGTNLIKVLSLCALNSAHLEEKKKSKNVEAVLILPEQNLVLLRNVRGHKPQFLKSTCDLTFCKIFFIVVITVYLMVPDENRRKEKKNPSSLLCFRTSVDGHVHFDNENLWLLLSVKRKSEYLSCPLVSSTFKLCYIPCIHFFIRNCSLGAYSQAQVMDIYQIIISRSK
jgi:hypothetical protein